jgi:hypothetical protein
MMSRDRAIGVLIAAIKDQSVSIGDKVTSHTPQEAENIVINAGLQALHALGVAHDEIAGALVLLHMEGVFTQ